MVVPRSYFFIKVVFFLMKLTNLLFWFCLFKLVDLVLQPLRKLVLSWLLGMAGLVLMCGIAGGICFAYFFT